MNVHWLRFAIATATMIVASQTAVSAEDRPNILWITCEDISPDVGCFGQPYAVTPNLDKLATQGVRYTRAFAAIGVCAPSRSSLILGLLAPTVGSHHMRCQIELPTELRCFPAYLRDAGYYTTNNVKTDYNFSHPKDTWDESSARAHWRNRKDGQPFFAVFNSTTSHESQIRSPEAQYRKKTAKFTADQRHDPAKAPLPPYHPDTPEVRQDWARYHDMITLMDQEAGAILTQLEQDGLAESTIVFYFSDHGAGMPRSKRWLYDSSTRVPMIVRFPDRYKAMAPAAPGATVDRLVSFIDFGPTVLSLAGVKVPATMRGVPFLGAQNGPPRTYVHGFRDRMDERTDMLRSVRDERFKYIRNYHPERPWFRDQFVSYMFEMPTMKVWQRMADAGSLTGARAAFMTPTKPTEELYDTKNDPWELHNLADDPAFRETLQRLRDEHHRWRIDAIDLGLLPEADLRSRFGEEPAYSAVRRDPTLYPIEKIAAAADLANARQVEHLPRLRELLHDADPAVRYWAAVGVGSLGEPGAKAADALRASATGDQAGFVRVAAADAMARVGLVAEAVPLLGAAMKDPNDWTRLAAIEALDRLDDAARPILETLKNALTDKNPYVIRVAKHAVEPFGIQVPEATIP
jgi:uncharacterized sulfatase